MSTLILYASKSGASKECAHLVGAQLSNCAICDISIGTPNIESYDTLVIGSGIRMRRLYKPIQSFLNKNKDILLSKKTAFYLCNFYPDTLAKAIEKSIPKELADRAICIEALGGKQPFTSPKNQDWVKMDKVAAFIKAIGE